MTDSQRIKCHGIIHAAAGAAGAAGAGLAQIPVADAVPITAAQITMVISLGAVFDIPVSEAMAKAMCRGFAAALGGRFIAAQVLGVIPFFGNAIKAGIAASITEKICWKAAEQFDKEAQQKVIPSSL